MTIAQIDREVESIIARYSVYGAECLINALVRAGKNQQYVDVDMLHKLIDEAARREKNE